MAFFNIASFYIQRSDQKTSTRENGIKRLVNDSSHLGFITSDSKGRFKGSASYQKYQEQQLNKKRWAVAIASPFGKSSAIVHYSRTKEKKEETEVQNSNIVFGLTHILDESFSFGLTVQDPFKKNVALYWHHRNSIFLQKAHHING